MGATLDIVGAKQDGKNVNDAELSVLGSVYETSIGIPRCQDCGKLLRGMRRDAKFCGCKCAREHRKKVAAGTAN